jgi:DNA-binding NarL/FixJ family response regulator
MSGTEPAAVLIADDHPLLRHGVRVTLEAEPDFRVVAEAADGAAAVEMAIREQVDLAILDVAMPRMTGLQATIELSRRAPDIGVIVLSMYDNERYVQSAMQAGAAGYVVKSVVDRDLITACRAVLRGERYFVGSSSGPSGPPRRLYDPLSPRETEVLKLIAEAHSTTEIAKLLVLSERTVERHRANILEKLGMKNRVELTRYAVRQGLVEP